MSRWGMDPCPSEPEARRAGRRQAERDVDYGERHLRSRRPYDCEEANDAFQRAYRYEFEALREEEARREAEEREAAARAEARRMEELEYERMMREEALEEEYERQRYEEYLAQMAEEAEGVRPDG